MSSDVAIGDCIIAGIQADDNSIEQMQAILANLTRAGYEIVQRSDVEKDIQRCLDTIENAYAFECEAGPLNINSGIPIKS